MKYTLLFLILFCSLSLWGQNVRIDGVAQSRTGAPAPGALIAVCSQPATITTQPCTPLVPLCASLSDVACTSPNPVTSDGLGNYFFYTKPGGAPLTYQFYGSGITTKILPDQAPGSSAVSGGVVLNPSADQTITGPHVLSLTGGGVLFGNNRNLPQPSGGISNFLSYSDVATTTGSPNGRTNSYFALYGWHGPTPTAGIESSAVQAQAVVDGGSTLGNLVGFLDFDPAITGGSTVFTYLAFYCDHAGVSSVQVIGPHVCFSGYTGAGGWGGDFYGSGTGGSVALGIGRICHSTDAIANGGTPTDCWWTGTGSPNSVVSAAVGSFYAQRDGGAGTSIWFKESGSGNTGWLARSDFTGSNVLAAGLNLSGLTASLPVCTDGSKTLTTTSCLTLSFASPSPIGSTMPNTGVFTTLNGAVFALNGGNTVQQAMTAASTNGLSIVPATYAASDIPSGTHVANLLWPTTTSQSNGAHLLDERFGIEADSIYNPGYDALNNIRSAREEITNWNTPIGNSSVNNIYSRLVQTNVLSGTQNWNQNGYTNKTNVAAEAIQTNVWSNSQVNAAGSSTYCYGNGDCIPFAIGVVDWGGANAGSDEGMHVFGSSASQGYVEYAGTSAAASAGATAVTVTTSQGSGTQGEGRPLYDITKAYTTGTLTSITGSSGLDILTGSSTLWAGATFGSAASTATTTSAAITVTGSNTTPGSVNIQVGASAGLSAAAGNVACVADPSSFEYVTLTAIPDGTHVTAVFLQPHASGATIAQGGMCGWGLSVDADVWSTPGSIGFVTVVGSLRQIWPIVSSSSATSATVWISVGANGTGYDGSLAAGGSYHLFPMTFSAPGTNNQSNTIPTQPLAVPFAASDSVALAMYPAFKFSWSNAQLNRFFPSPGIAASGAGLSFNGVYNGNDVFWGVANNTASSLYNINSLGGHLTPPLAFFEGTGIARSGVYFPTSPNNVITVGCPANGCAALRTVIGTVFSGSGGTDLWGKYDSGNEGFSFTTAHQTLTWAFDQNGVFTLPKGNFARLAFQGSSSGTENLQANSTATAVLATAGIGTTDASFGSNLAFFSSACETAFAPTTLATGATTTDTGQTCLPANSIIDAVVARVTTTITSACTGWELGDATTPARFSSNNTGLTSGTTTDATHIGTFNNTGMASATTGTWQAAAAKVRITCAGGNPGAGAVRVIVYFHTWTAPTS